MTNQEAIETIEANYPPENYSMLREALNMAIVLLKKQEPKAYIGGYTKYGDAFRHCPSCETTLPNSGIYGKSNFCYRCGQAVK